ncbi:hypothetical protein MiSe_84390 [Microseira wollei NIES-4236]|uniref:Transposase n=1 Tax=Microseira wollei NIES-4236 TaxID=2530354 RepID=A0AAV3WNZ7_9CYAN|nr:hypothetical protein MiSe_84390 [Microseira wollei NIES-4236]
MILVHARLLQKSPSSALKAGGTPTPQEFFWFCGLGILPAPNIFAKGSLTQINDNVQAKVLN